MRPRAAWMLAILCAAQSQTETPVFRSTTRLVQFSVVALDKRGAPVKDLKQEDFVVQENGKPRALAFFRFDGGPAPREAGQALPAGLFTNRVEYTPGPPRNITAIVLDTLNTQPADYSVVRAQLIQSLRVAGPETRLAVFHLGSRLSILHDFTEDSESLRQRVARLTGEIAPQALNNMQSEIAEAEVMVALFPNDPHLKETLQRQIETKMLENDLVRTGRVTTTLESMESLGRHLAGIPGRKSLVWISGGISSVSITGEFGSGPRGGVRSFDGMIRATAERLAQQDIALYIVDARGLTSSEVSSTQVSVQRPQRGRGTFERQADADVASSDTRGAMGTLAGRTGGRVFINSNDLTAGIQSAAQDASGSYTLAYYTPDEPDGKWHNLKVKVNRPSVTLRHRAGFQAAQTALKSQDWDAAQWHAAIWSPLGSSAILLSARCERLKGAQAGELGVAVQIEPENLALEAKDGQYWGELDVVIATKSPDGKAGLHSQGLALQLTPERRQAMQRDGLLYAHQWKPAAGATSVRVIVRDRRSGHYGTLDLALNKLPAQ